MSTRSAGIEMQATEARTPQVQTQIQMLQVVIEKLRQNIGELTTVLHPVLAELVGDKTASETGTVRGGLAPLAEDLAKLGDLIAVEVVRISSLAKRCEV